MTGCILEQQYMFGFFSRMSAHKCAKLRNPAHSVIAVALLITFAPVGAWGLTSPQQAEKTKAIVDRFEISPKDVTLAADQTLRFKVTDTKGKVIPVHWTLSGIYCKSSACGMIDDNGDYVAPSSISSALSLVLEGFLISDPRHSVLTRIQLVPNVNAVDAVTQVAAGVSNGDMPAPLAPAGAENNISLSAEPLTARDKDSAVSARTDASSKSGTVVTYEDGLLAITAENTSLAAVLKLVAQKTGAVIDLPPGSGQEPIVAHAGPGRASDVVAQLLKGSRFNFVVVSSPRHPYEPERVILSWRPEEIEVAKSVSAPATAVASPVPKASPESAAPVPVVVPEVDSILTPPKEPLSPEALGELMKQKARELRDKFQQEAPRQ
jgi:hypothetical protein